MPYGLVVPLSPLLLLLLSLTIVCAIKLLALCAPKIQSHVPTDRQQ